MKFVPQCHDSFEHAPTIVFLELTKRKPALEDDNSLLRKLTFDAELLGSVNGNRIFCQGQ